MRAGRIVLALFATGVTSSVGCQAFLGLESSYVLGDASTASDGAATDGTTSGDADDGHVTLPGCPGKTGYVCTLGTIPTDWTPVAFTKGNSASACPTTYGAGSTAVVGDLDASTTCPCSCPTGFAVGCQYQIVFGTAGPPTCSGASIAGARLTDAGCGPAGSPGSGGQASIDPGEGIGVNPLSGVAVTCPPQPSWSPADASTVPGELCGLAADADTRDPCEAGVCVPDPGAFEACIAHVGEVACPPGFARRSVVGTSVRDDRSCPGACTCTANVATCTATVEFYAADMCAGPTVATRQVTPELCDPYDGGGTVTLHTARVVEAGGGCTASVSGGSTTADGAASLTSAQTVCCAGLP